MLLVLKLVKTKYCFMLGDDDLIIRGKFNKILKILSKEDFDLILLTEISQKSKRKTIKLSADITLNDCRDFFDEYWDKMPFGSIIINLELAKNVDAYRFIGTSHAYTGLIWEYLAKKNLEKGSINVLVVSDPIVLRGESLKTYRHKLSELIFLEIPKWFKKLPPVYNSKKAKIKYMRRQETFRNLAIHRIEGQLNNLNYKYLSCNFSLFGKVKIIVISIFPKIFLENIITAYRFLSKFKRG